MLFLHYIVIVLVPSSTLTVPAVPTATTSPRGSVIPTPTEQPASETEHGLLHSCL